MGALHALASLYGDMSSDDEEEDGDKQTGPFKQGGLLNLSSENSIYEVTLFYDESVLTFKCLTTNCLTQIL